MKILDDERQRRINLIEKENVALKKLNDFSEIKKRVQDEKSLVEQANIIEETSPNPVKKIASPSNDPVI